MKRGGGVSGAVSLVMIFCVLCLAVFAVLTLSTADREAKLARLTAENAANYYEADRQAVELLANLAAGREIPADVVWAMTGGEEGTLVDLTLPVREEQSLEVRARLSQDAGSWEILRWRSVYSGDWAADETIEIWDGP